MSHLSTTQPKDRKSYKIYAYRHDGGAGSRRTRASGGQGSRVHPLRIASSPLSTTRTLVLIDLFTVRALYEAVTLRVFKFRRVSVVFRGDHIRL